MVQGIIPESVSLAGEGCARDTGEIQFSDDEEDRTGLGQGSEGLMSEEIVGKGKATECFENNGKVF